jgi:hypothetical protein
MHNLLAMLADMPTWAIYGVVGGILGALGGVLGWIIERWLGWKVRQFLVIAAVASTFSITKHVVIPRVLDAYLNRDLPKKIDPYTVFDHASFRDREYTYHYTLSDEAPDDTDVQAIKQKALKDMCANFNPAFLDGSVSKVNYEYSVHGRAASFSLLPSDCT